jgi:hypothetical protein
VWFTRIYNLITVRHYIQKNVKNIGDTYEITLKKY